MIIILYVSAAVVAVAFFILVIGLVKTMKSVQITLDSVSNTLDDLKDQLEGITTETTLLLNKTNAITEDLQGKVEKLDTVVNAVQEVGHTVHALNNSVQQVSHSVSNTMVRNQDKIAQVVQWGAAINELRGKFFGESKEQTKKDKQPLFRKRKPVQQTENDTI